jgi:anthranilate/para-aminobenzoate synthase component II
MLLGIDNHDSLPYNLVQCLGKMGVDMQVHRNDQITVEAGQWVSKQ